jgi:hypothetical protein
VSKDTLVFEKEVPGAKGPVVTKVLTVHDTIRYVETICPEREEEKDVPATINEEIKKPPNKWGLIGLGYLLGVISFLFVVLFVRRGR